MKKRSSLFVFTMVALVAGALALVLVGCSAQSGGSSGSTSSGSEPSTTVTDSEDVVTIYLEYSAGTGYEWTYEEEPDGNLTLLGQETQNMEKDPTVAGGKLREAFTFRAAKPGEVVLTFKLARSWESGEPAETQVYAFAVNNQLKMTLNPYKSNFDLEPEWGANA